jgi:hypothetical protein
MAELFDYLNDLTYQKKNLSKSDDAFEKTYEPFFVVRALSQHLDTLLIANELNKHPMVSKQMHHDYVFHCVRSRKRTGKWAKADKDVAGVELVMAYYGYSKQKAAEAVKILNKAELEVLANRMSTGGRTK